MIRVLGVCATIAAGIAFGAQAQDVKSDLEYSQPAQGCPTRMPTMQSAEHYCGAQTQGACKFSANLCEWSGGKCEAKAGTYINIPSMDPRELSQFSATDFTLITPASVKRMLDAAYIAAAGKKYDQAIALYNKALKEEYAKTDYLVKRGLIYELKGDKKSALYDYCMGLAIANDWQSEQIAQARIVQISQPDVERLPIPRFALSGVLRMKGQSLAPFNVITPPGHDYLVKLVNERTKKEDVLIFVRANSEYHGKVPLGKFRIIGAHGPVWYGEPHYFGNASTFFKLQPNDQDEVVTFYQKGNTVYGKTATFKPTPGGNLKTPSITREEFEDN